MERRAATFVSMLLLLAFFGLALTQVDAATTFGRIRRETPVADDLRDTPCAPNDYLKIDCNTCYCNMDRTGYLCTENNCHDGETIDSFPTTQIPLPNDTMLIISSKGAQFIDNYSHRNTEPEPDNGLNVFGRFSRDGRSQTELTTVTNDTSSIAATDATPAGTGTEEGTTRQ